MEKHNTLRTRSQAAPDWTHQEHLILVNEITAVERDCLNTFSSFQKWKMIVENCNALGLNRSLNQCKKKWNMLFDDYNNLKNFDPELYKAIYDFVRVRDGRTDSDPDIDPSDKDVDLGDDLLVNVFAQSVSSHTKKYKRKIMPKKHFLEGWGARRKISKNVRKLNKLCRSEVKVELELERPKESVGVKSKKKESNQEEKVENLTTELLNSAEQINAVLEGKFVEEVDNVLADLESAKTTQAVNVRRQGDELITCLENYTHTLDQLCQILKSS